MHGMNTTRRLRTGDRWQLICIPFAGGAAHAYRPLAAAMPDRWEVVAVNPPGHGGRPGPLPSSFDELTAACEAAVAAVARPPYVLLGHSLGGLVAYRVARRLAASPLAPRALVLSGCVPPENVRTPPPPSAADDQELVRFLAEAGGTDQRLLAHPEFLDYILPILRSDLNAIETFTEPDPSPLGVQALLLAGSDDVRAPASLVAGWQARLPDAGLHLIRGDHMFVITAPAATAETVRVLEAEPGDSLRKSGPRSS